MGVASECFRTCIAHLTKYPCQQEPVQVSFSVNAMAKEIVDEIITRKKELGCIVTQLENGATLVDAGIDTEGTPELGRLVGEVCMGGLGTVRLSAVHLDELTLPNAIVSTNEPTIACLGSQYAGWKFKSEGYLAMVSGPARALARGEGLYDEIGYADSAKVGVAVLETRAVPDEKVMDDLASKCDIDTKDLYCIVAPTASIVGSVQIAARIVEVGVHKLRDLGYDSRKIRSGHGVAPIAPVAKKDTRAMGMTNDCILYGGQVYLFIRPDDDDDLAELTKNAVSSSSEQYGKPFYDLFKSVDFDFYKVDPLLFSPAEITISDVTTGEIHKAGQVNYAVLKESLGL